jgi:lipopolysaccharide transport system ATP-binding protein
VTLPVVEVVNVGKVYRRFRNAGELMRGLLFGDATQSEHKALDDVSVTIGAGESVGLVGRNGAGKSTLLKIIAGTLQPTTGSAIVRGRSSAILELGLGFHPAFSGRENIYLGGLCLGLTREEIDARFDEIVAFSEIGEALERPFGTYSTGMQARLSFSVASSVEAKLMIVDEALSVGDARFQLKCFDRFAEMRAKGTTFILVSHSMPTIVSFCDRALLLEGGRIMEDDTPQAIDRAYQRVLFGRAGRAPGPTEPAKEGDEASNDRFGSLEGEIRAVTLLDDEGQLSGSLLCGRPFAVEARILMNKDVDDLVVGFLVRTPKGIDLFGVDNGVDRHPIAATAGQEIRVRLEGRMNLASGEYFLTVGLAHRDGTKIDLRYDVMQFSVIGSERQYATSVAFLDHRLVISAETPSEEAVP